MHNNASSEKLYALSKKLATLIAMGKDLKKY